MATVPKSSSPPSESTAAKRLSPRGRGSVARVDDDRLRDLFAANMRIIRIRRGLSQEELADLCDLDRTYVSSVERKKRNISIRNIQRIADALRADVRLFFTTDLGPDQFDAILGE